MSMVIISTICLLTTETPYKHMVRNRSIEFRGVDMTIGDTTRPVGDVVSIMTEGGGVRVMFRDGSSDVGGSITDLFTLRDMCPWAAVAL